VTTAYSEGETIAEGLLILNVVNRLYKDFAEKDRKKAARALMAALGHYLEDDYRMDEAV
jgi:hypothetical protein